MILKCLTLFFVFFLIADIYEGDALRCRPCSKRVCIKPKYCKGGLVKDICNCCDVCAKVKGQKCGGLWNKLGKCDKGLTCNNKKRHSKGICVRKCPPPLCKKKCKYGFVKKNGCAICKCKKGRTIGKKCGKRYGKCAKNLTCRRNRCVCKRYATCRIFCEYGFLPNRKSCRLCKCRRFPRRKGQTCSTKNNSPRGICRAGLRCVKGRCACGPICKRLCPNGFEKDKNKCPICKCKPRAKLGEKCKVTRNCLIGLRCFGKKCSCGPLCKLGCPNGFIKKNGCPICKCKPLGKVGETCQTERNCMKGLSCRNNKCACGPVCLIFCPNGNVPDANGCPTCKCNPLKKLGEKCDDKNKMKCESGLSCNNGKCGCPPVCAIFCGNGNVKDANGCPTCKCNPLAKLGETCKVTANCRKGLTCVGNKCSCGAVCAIACPNGNVLDKNGCKTCKCKPLKKKGEKCGGKFGLCESGLACVNGKCGCKNIAQCRIVCPFGFLPNKKGCILCKCRKKARGLGQTCGPRNTAKGVCKQGLKCSRGRCVRAFRKCKTRTSAYSSVYGHRRKQCKAKTTIFCNDRCRCCRHSTTCNPDPWYYLKTAECCKVKY